MLTSYSSTNSFPNNAFATTLITSSTSNKGGYTGVMTFNQPNTTLTVTATGSELGYSVPLVGGGGILVTPQATGTVITGYSFCPGDEYFTNGGAVVLIDYGSLTVASGIGEVPDFGGGALIVSGPGTTTLSGSNTYTSTTYIDGPGTTILSGTNIGAGAIKISGGKFYLNGSSATTAITVAGGATLGGSGTASSAAVRVARRDPGLQPKQCRQPAHPLGIDLCRRRHDQCQRFGRPVHDGAAR